MNHDAAHRKRLGGVAWQVRFRKGRRAALGAAGRGL